MQLSQHELILTSHLREYALTVLRDVAEWSGTVHTMRYCSHHVAAALYPGSSLRSAR